MKNLPKIETFLRRHQNMDMVRHHDPGAEVIALTVEMSQRAGHDFGGLRVREKA